MLATALADEAAVQIGMAISGQERYIV